VLGMAERSGPLVVAVVNLKGGSTKTTSAAFIAHVLHEQGGRVLMVDADPQGSALRWQETAEWPLSVIRLDSTRLHRELPGIVGDRYDWVVVDTPPLADHQGIVMSALRIATHVVVPVAPTPIEYERLSAVREAIADAADLRADGSGPETVVVLTRTVSGAASTEVYRELIEEDGLRVLRVTVGRLERFSQSYGQPILRATGTAYGDAVYEMFAGAPAPSSPAVSA